MQFRGFILTRGDKPLKNEGAVSIGKLTTTTPANSLDGDSFCPWIFHAQDPVFGPTTEALHRNWLGHGF